MDHPIPIPATFFQRASAWVFDVSLALWPASLLGMMATRPARRALEAQQAQAMGELNAGFAYLQSLAAVYLQQTAWTLAGVVLIYGVGSVWAEGGLHQATWGKRLMGVSVAAQPGRKDDHVAVAMRFAAGSLSWLTLNAGHALARWRTDKRALHDVVTGMRVIQEPMDPAKRRRGAWVCWGVFAATQLAWSMSYSVDPVLAQIMAQGLMGLG